MNLPAETILIIPKEKLGLLHINTHGIPLLFLIQYLEKEAEHIIFIGIQPQTIYGEINDLVIRSGDHLIDILRKKIEQIPIR